MNAIECSHVNKSFGDFAIQDLSFALPSGTICGLVGENGAGKSTTIRLIMGALAADGGTISVLGTDNKAPGFLQVKEDVGIVLDEAYFPEVLNAKQVGAVMADTYARWDMGVYQGYLDRFSLPSKKQFKDFSRGMKMKLAIAVALSHSPRLLILDEATSGLDPIVRDEILEIFSEFTRQEDHSILMSSHIVSDLEKLCDYIAFLHQGKLVFMEEKDRLLEEYGVVACGRQQLESLPEDAVCGVESSAYATRALVRRELISPSLAVERASIEDIMLFMVKGEKRK